MEPLLNKKKVKLNYVNIFQSKNNQTIKTNRKSNDKLKVNDLNHTKNKSNNQKVQNRNLIITNNKINSQGIQNNNNIKGNSFKNYINSIKNIYSKTNFGDYSHNNLNQIIKSNNTSKNMNYNNSNIHKNMVIKSNNSNTNSKNKKNLMNVLIKKKNNNSFNFNNINKLKNTKNKILPGLKNNKKSIDHTIKNNKLINSFTPNIILNDINNKTYNSKNLKFNIINNNINNIYEEPILTNFSKNYNIDKINNNQQSKTITTNTNTITEYPKINNNKIIIEAMLNNNNINSINNISSKDDSDLNLNLYYNKSKKISSLNKNKFEIFETDKVTVNYDKKTGNKIVNEFYFLDTIGRGAYSKVKKCINLNTREEFAVKILNKRLLRKKKKSYGKTKEGTLKINYMIDDALNEINIYKTFNEYNNNVIRLYQILNDNKKDKTYLIMELAQKGPLVTLNEKTGIFCINSNYNNNIYDEKLIKKWILDIAKGLKFLHENNVVHRDIKSDNILIDKNGVCKIADFGCSIKLKPNQPDLFSKTEGNMYFFPPEFVDGKSKKQFGYKPVDIWAFGVSIYTCIFKSLPFLPENRENVVELFKEIREAKFDFNKNGIKISKDMEILLGHILDKDPNKRFTAKDIVNYPWLNSN